MCKEERRIYFTTRELIEALGLFCETSHQYFPFNKNAELSFKTKPNIVAVVSDPGSSDEPCEFPESEIGVALILFCKKNAIPVARRAEKSLELSDGSIVFVMKINDEEAPAEVSRSAVG